MFLSGSWKCEVLFVAKSAQRPFGAADIFNKIRR